MKIFLDITITISILFTLLAIFFRLPVPTGIWQIGAGCAAYRLGLMVAEQKE